MVRPWVRQEVSVTMRMMIRTMSFSMVSREYR